MLLEIYTRFSCALICCGYIMHYSDVILGAMASQINSLTILYSTVYLGLNQRKYHSSASLAFVRGILRCPGNSPHKWPVTRKMFGFDDVIMGQIYLVLLHWHRDSHKITPTPVTSPWRIWVKSIGSELHETYHCAPIFDKTNSVITMKWNFVFIRHLNSKCLLLHIFINHGPRSENPLRNWPLLQNQTSFDSWINLSYFD